MAPRKTAVRRVTHSPAESHPRPSGTALDSEFLALASGQDKNEKETRIRMSAGINIKLISHSDSLANLKNEWGQLLSESSTKSAFLS